MSFFRYQNHQLVCESVPLAHIAEEFKTPCYVYSETALTAAFAAYRTAFVGVNPLICYAVKANSNLSILAHFARLGAGFDIVSGGELARVLAAGAEPSRIIFSGVGKTHDEIKTALKAHIGCFNVESEEELARIQEVASWMGVQAPISLRINPNVDAKTHPYISTGLKNNKFGIAWDDAFAVYDAARRMPNLDIIGIDCHIGSQLLDVSPLLDALDRTLQLVDRLKSAGIVLKHIDLGGGIGIPYQNEAPPDLLFYAQEVQKRLAGRALQLILEPGRSLVGNAGVLLTKVEFNKVGEDKNFVIVDAAMNDLARPALYDAYHEILPLDLPKMLDAPPSEDSDEKMRLPHQLAQVYRAALEKSGAALRRADVVGPVCESADFLGKDRLLAVQSGDVLAVLSAGAYGFTMSSNYNTRPRAAEVLVRGAQCRLIRERETIDQLLANEEGLLISA